MITNHIPKGTKRISKSKPLFSRDDLLAFARYLGIKDIKALRSFNAWYDGHGFPRQKLTIWL
ncbi:hypothetical protein LCGC14_1227900 [marine sediment metagenome]|uniref:Uncharacterized protein n=1 Tax=marine sediment metagenome TaxID=412755 RepID=A0A0F9LWK2_9ZZZZ|nr:hypothetical protein [Candidatus Scalindua sp.]